MGKPRTPQEGAAFNKKSFLSENASFDKGSYLASHGAGLGGVGLGYGGMDGGGGGGGAPPGTYDEEGDQIPPLPPRLHRTFTPLDPAKEIDAARQQNEENYGQHLTNNVITRAAQSAASGIKDVGETLGTAAGELVTHPASSLKQGLLGVFEGAGFDTSIDPNSKWYQSYPADKRAQAIADAQAERQRTQDEAPASRRLGQIGTQAYAGSRIGAAVGPALGAAAEGAALPGGAVGRTIARGATGAATGEAVGAGTSLLSGGDVHNAIAEGAVGGGTAGLMAGPVSAAGKAIRNKIRSPKTELGRGIGAAERLYGDNAVGLRVKGAQGIDAGERGIAQLARGSADELQGIGQDARAAAGAEYDNAVKGLAYKRTDPFILKVGLDNAIRATEAENGAVLFPELRSKLELARRAITNPGGAVDPLGATMMPGQGGSVAVEDLLKVKRMLDAEANWGMPATPAQAQIRKAATSFSDLIGRVDPALGQAQANYAARMGELENYNAGLYGKDEPVVPDNVAMRNRLAKRLGSQGQGEGSPGAAHQELDLEAARQQFPDIGNYLDAPLAERFKQGVSIGSPKMTITPSGPVARSNLGAIEDVALARGVYPAARALEGLKDKGRVPSIISGAARKKKEKDKQ